MDIFTLDINQNIFYGIHFSKSKIILIREFVVFFRKILIIIVVNVIDYVLPAKALLLILILVLSIYTQMEFSPFQIENFQRFENLLKIGFDLKYAKNLKI